MADEKRKPETITDNAKQVIGKLKERAAVVLRDWRENESVFRKCWVKRAKLALEIQAKELWKYMPKPGPFDSLSSWMDSVQIARSTFYDLTTPYDGLKKLGDATLEKIPQENAKRLARLPESKRYDPKIIKQAMEMPEDKFKEATHRYLPGVAEPEGRVPLTITCYSSQKKLIEKSMEKFAKKYGLDDDKGRILELICADAIEVTDRVREVFPQLAHFVIEMGKVYKSELALDEIHSKLQKPLADALALIESVGALIPPEPKEKKRTAKAAA
jgi:hypothetical protein